MCSLSGTVFTSCSMSPCLTSPHRTACRETGAKRNPKTPCCWQLTPKTTKKDRTKRRSVSVVVWVHCQQQGTVRFLLALVSLRKVQAKPFRASFSSLRAVRISLKRQHAMSSINLCLVAGSLEGCMHLAVQLLVLAAALRTFRQSPQARRNSRTAYKERDKA